MIRHIVLLQPKAETTDEAISGVLEQVETLRTTVRGIADIQAGTNRSLHHQGYTHGFELRFYNEDDLEASVAHPDQQRIAAELARLCQQMIEFDLVELPPPARKSLKETIAPEVWQAKSAEERLRLLLIDQLDVPEEELVSSASFVEDLNADSLDLVEIIFAMEEEFQVEISNEQAERITTVGEALVFLQEKGAPLEEASSSPAKKTGRKANR